MKFEDCQVGMRVKFYDHKYGARVGEIIEIGSARGMVAVKSPQSVDYAYPEQLRKIVKKKKPEIVIVVGADDELVSYSTDINATKELVDKWKANSFDVWLMRGVRKL
jgi:hypothetical protein